MQHTNLACIILAGGTSSRMGRDKRRLRLWGDTGPMLLEHILSTITPWCAEPIVVLNDPEAWSNLPAHTVSDHVQGAGPLAGLIAGLAAMRATRTLVLACDMPCVQLELIALLAGIAANEDAIVPQQFHNGNLTAEPLLAIYQRHCLPIAEACLVQGERRMHAFLQQLNVRYVPPAEWQIADRYGISFRNLNRPVDVSSMRQ
jgi:molybdenum cofactor guanylyltransferase